MNTTNAGLDFDPHFYPSEPPEVRADVTREATSAIEAFTDRDIVEAEATARRLIVDELRPGRHHLDTRRERLALPVALVVLFQRYNRLVFRNIERARQADGAAIAAAASQGGQASTDPRLTGDYEEDRRGAALASHMADKFDAAVLAATLALGERGAQAIKALPATIGGHQDVVSRADAIAAIRATPSERGYPCPGTASAVCLIPDCDHKTPGSGCPLRVGLDEDPRAEPTALVAFEAKHGLGTDPFGPARCPRCNQLAHARAEDCPFHGLP